MGIRETLIKHLPEGSSLQNLLKYGTEKHPNTFPDDYHFKEEDFFPKGKYAVYIDGLSSDEKAEFIFPKVNPSEVDKGDWPDYIKDDYRTWLKYGEFSLGSLISHGLSHDFDEQKPQTTPKPPQSSSTTSSSTSKPQAPKIQLDTRPIHEKIGDIAYNTSRKFGNSKRRAEDWANMQSTFAESLLGGDVSDKEMNKALKSEKRYWGNTLAQKAVRTAKKYISGGFSEMEQESHEGPFVGYEQHYNENGEPFKVEVPDYSRAKMDEFLRFTLKYTPEELKYLDRTDYQLISDTLPEVDREFVDNLLFKHGVHGKYNSRAEMMMSDFSEVVTNLYGVLTGSPDKEDPTFKYPTYTYGDKPNCQYHLHSDDARVKDIIVLSPYDAGSDGWKQDRDFLSGFMEVSQGVPIGKYEVVSED